jgi:AraC family transcriptional regulator, arabinose operon regulatory protein
MKSERNKFGASLVAGTSHYAQTGHGATLRPSGLNNWVLNLTLQGRGRIGSGSPQFLAEEGDVLLFPPRLPHDYSHEKQAGQWLHLWIYFNPPSHLVHLLRWPVKGQGVLGFPLADLSARAKVRQAMEKCLEMFRSPLKNRLLFCGNSLEEALLWCDTQNPFSGGTGNDERIDHAVAYMLEHFAGDLDADSIARECNLSTSRFAHLFRETTGTSPLRYLESLRIWKAQEMLIGTSKSIKEISQTVGFQDPLYFSKVFRRNLATGPRAFRKESRESPGSRRKG